MTTRTRRTLRYQSNAGFTAQAITWADLLDTIYMAGTATTGYRLFEAVKINSICMYAQGATANTTSLVLVYGSTQAGFQGDDKVWTATSMGIAQPCVLRTRPDPKSLSSMFQYSSTVANAFTMSGPAEAIIDIDLTYVQNIFRAGAAIQQAPVGASAGEIYIGQLDGLRGSGGSVFPPAMLGVNVN